MAEIRPSPRLARNAVLAALAVLATTAAVTAGAVRPGAGEQTCPGGQDWVVAEPVGVAVAGYEPATPPDAAALPDAAAPRETGTADTVTADTVTQAAAAAQQPTMAGCLNTDLLDPTPVTGDGRG